MQTRLFNGMVEESDPEYKITGTLGMELCYLVWRGKICCSIKTNRIFDFTAL